VGLDLAIAVSEALYLAMNKALKVKNNNQPLILLSTYQSLLNKEIWWFV